VHRSEQEVGGATADLDRLVGRFDEALERLTAAPAFAKPGRVRPVLDTGRRLLLLDGGCTVVEQRAARIEAAGLFLGTDWEQPQLLDAALTPRALTSADADTVLLEVLSDLRLLAVARGDLVHPTVSSEHAHHHLTQVLALNLSMLFGGAGGEVRRGQPERLTRLARSALGHVADRVGYEHVMEQVVDEIWRILRQRPIQVDHVKRMITEVAVYRDRPDLDLGSRGHGADRLISSLYGTTEGCREDPGLDVYRDRLATMDPTTLQNEASGFARAMHDTGLVSPYHAVLLDELRVSDDRLLGMALGLTSTGRDCLIRYHELVDRLVEAAVTPATAQAVYGLALLLERGLLHDPAVPPALWRQLGLELAPPVRARLAAVLGDAVGPETWLLAGVLSMLGQPLGVGQGDNPTCQSARALSMWAHNDPDYLLQMVVWAARDEEVVMHFEGQPISSADVAAGVAATDPVDLDPVSLVVVPHLDRIYAEMGRRCVGRLGDPHRWVNPEFHGWWSWRGFRIDVDVATGQLDDVEGFLRHFYATYHPVYNGDQPLVHPQPAGVAVTDSAGRFVGWHAITLLRVDRDPQGVMRMYFFNPNNDSGQDWGDGVVVSTSHHGEHFGESSLPFDEFASRLYIFHHDPLEGGEPVAIADEELGGVIAMIHRTWGRDRRPPTGLQAHPGPGR
jgi:hypothetical protein